MSNGTLALALSHIRSLVGRHPPGDDPDQILLQRFIAARDQSAFEQLLHRHGPMVLGVCRRLLRHEQDAEDAFQATFLVLARKAATVRRQASVASWLYGVAFRVAAKARSRAARRRLVAALTDAEFESAEPAVGDSGPDSASLQEARAVLDEELRSLPGRDRELLVLCHLQGLTHEQAAQSLRVPVGSMSRHLARARDLLRGRLVRRGVVLTAAGLTAALADASLRAAPGAALTTATARGIIDNAAGRGGVRSLSPAAVSLAEAFFKDTLMTKLTFSMAAALAVALIGLGAGGLHYSGSTAEGAPPPASEKGNPVADRGDSPPPPDEAPRNAPPVRGTAAQRERLMQPFDFPGFPDARTTLEEALDYMTKRYGLTFRVNEGAFMAEQVQDVLNTPITEKQPVREMKAVSPEVVLRLILDRVASDSGTTYLVKPDGIEITTVRYSTPGEWPAAERAAVPRISVVLESKPLDQALRGMAEKSGITILIDPKTGEKAKADLTADLKGVPLDTAVELLADMAGLKAVAVENVLYVTTVENAKTWDSRRGLGKPKQ
jgi:RNA polymerase sigma factor (sigma-70 family)